jgi:hypothetical protein
MQVGLCRRRCLLFLNLIGITIAVVRLTNVSDVSISQPVEHAVKGKCHTNHVYHKAEAISGGLLLRKPVSIDALVGADTDCATRAEFAAFAARAAFLWRANLDRLWRLGL